MKKFIISKKGKLILGDVNFHFELLPTGDTTCYGGGIFEMNDENKILNLYGRSVDFGKPQFDKLTKIPVEINNYKILYNGEEIDNRKN